MTAFSIFTTSSCSFFLNIWDYGFKSLIVPVASIETGCGCWYLACTILVWALYFSSLQKHKLLCVRIWSVVQLPSHSVTWWLMKITATGISVTCCGDNFTDDLWAVCNDYSNDYSSYYSNDYSLVCTISWLKTWDFICNIHSTDGEKAIQLETFVICNYELLILQNWKLLFCLWKD